MEDKQSYILGLVRDAIASVPDIHQYKTEIALRSGEELPGFYSTIMTNTGEAVRYEEDEYTEKAEQLLIAVFLEFEVPARDVNAEGLLMQEYLRLYQLIEYATESQVPSKRAVNDYYIILTGRPACIGGSPLFDDEAMRGSAEIMIQVTFSSERQ